jgi:predicted nuclease of predicted toxin-antitoxin system
MNSFLIDECLSPKLVAAAQIRGYAAIHVAHLNREGTEDWAIAQLALQRDAIFVTNNARDFLALYARFDIHPGLVIILPNVGRAPQIALFELGIDFIERHGDIVNQVVEIAADGEVSVRDWSRLNR